MGARARSMDFRYQVSGIERYRVLNTWYTKPTRTAMIGESGECSDVVGSYHTDNPLMVVRNYVFYPSLDGVQIGQSDGLPYREFASYPLDYRTQPPLDSRTPFPSPSSSELAAMASEAAAKTNPSVAHVSIPAFVGELRDFPALMRSIPEMLGDRGRAYLARGLVRVVPRARKYSPRLGNWANRAGNPLKRAAAANLAYRFGWRPFLNDLLKMLAFADAVHQRLKWLVALLEGKSIKRRMQLPSLTSSTDFGTIYTHTSSGSRAYVKHRRQVLYRAKSWVSTRWTLSSLRASELPESPEEIVNLALRLTYGITGYDLFAAMWELLPWSWFIDWFWNIGNFIAANANTLPVSLGSVCWCRTTSSLTMYDVVQGPQDGARLTGEFFQGQVRKERVPIPVILALLPPLPSIPFLSKGQWSILGSLVVQKMR